MTVFIIFQQGIYIHTASTREKAEEFKRKYNDGDINVQVGYVEPCEIKEIEVDREY